MLGCVVGMRGVWMWGHFISCSDGSGEGNPLLILVLGSLDPWVLALLT